MRKSCLKAEPSGGKKDYCHFCLIINIPKCSNTIKLEFYQTCWSIENIKRADIKNKIKEDPEIVSP